MNQNASVRLSREQALLLLRKVGVEISEEREEYLTIHLHAMVLPDKLDGATVEQIAELHGRVLDTFHQDNRVILEYVITKLPQNEILAERIAWMSELFDQMYHATCSLISLIADVHSSAFERVPFGERRRQTYESAELAREIRKEFGTETSEGEEETLGGLGFPGGNGPGDVR